MEKAKLKNISDNLERITGCPLILHNQSETMAKILGITLKCNFNEQFIVIFIIKND